MMHRTYLIVCLVLLIIGVHPASPSQASFAELILPVSYWEQKFLAEVWPTTSDAYLSCEQNASGFVVPGATNDLYHLGPCIDGHVAMFQATGKAQYLERALGWTERVMRALKLDPETGYVTWPMATLELGHSWRSVARMLRVMRETPAVYGNAALRSRYEPILAFTEKHVFQNMWDYSLRRIEEKGSNGHHQMYRSRTHMASHWAMIGMNLALLSKDPVWLPRYREVAAKINGGSMQPYRPSSLRQQMQVPSKAKDAYIFHDEWGKRYEEPGSRSSRTYAMEGYHPVSDTYHAQDVIGYIVEAEHLNNYWTRADLNRLGVLLKKLTWNGSLSQPRFSYWLDGSTSETTGCLEEGFLMLGRYDREIQMIFQHRSPRGCHAEEFYGQMALNAAILSGKHPSHSPLARGATPIPTATPAVVSGCASPTTVALSAGSRWYASANGIGAPRGVRLQSTGDTFAYLARWNGSVYQYTRVVPAAPSWLTYEQDVDFMLYNNSHPFAFRVCR